MSNPDCTSCGAEIAPGDDFCRACGHSVAFGNDQLDRAGEGEDNNAGVICPGCGATHQVIGADGITRCETCGFSSVD